MWPAPEVIAQMGTRERLILGALQLISEDPERFSAGTLLQRTGLSKGALYHHFASLEALLEAAAGFEVDKRLVDAERRYAEYPTLGAWLRAYGAEMLQFAASPAFLNILLYFNQRGLNHAGVRQQLCAQNNATFARLGRIVQSYYPLRIEHERLRQISALLLFTLEGVAAHGTLQSQRERFVGAWEWLIQALQRDLAAYESSVENADQTNRTV